MSDKQHDSVLATWSTTSARSSPPSLVPAHRLDRRALLGLLGVVGGGLALGISRVSRAAGCATGTRNPIQGPYYLGDPEERNDTGEGIIITGRVLDDQTCQPVAGAVIVRWHANDLGFYEEFYRAKMTVGADGAYAMSTIPPGQYAGLARHVHWYVVAPGYAPVIAQTQWQDNETIAGTQNWDFSLTRSA